MLNLNSNTQAHIEPNKIKLQHLSSLNQPFHAKADSTECTLKYSQGRVQDDFCVCVCVCVGGVGVSIGSNYRT